MYVDAGAAAHGAGATFVLETPAGDVRHLGTQYAVRTLDGTVLVNVREGSVAIERGRDRIVGNAGEQLSVTSSGAVVRTTIAPRDTQWAWVESIAPPFAIEGRPLDDFLAWAARETGRQLVYTSPAAAAEAASIKLKGSVGGTRPGCRTRSRTHDDAIAASSRRRHAHTRRARCRRVGLRTD